MMSFPLLMSMAMPLIILVITSPMSFPTSNDIENQSPFECGFDPTSPSRKPFSLSFFLIAMMFLIFDVEMVLLLPIPLLFMENNITPTFIVLIVITILILGLLHEWNEGSLYWK